MMEVSDTGPARSFHFPSELGPLREQALCQRACARMLDDGGASTCRLAIKGGGVHGRGLSYHGLEGEVGLDPTPGQPLLRSGRTLRAHVRDRRFGKRRKTPFVTPMFQHTFRVGESRLLARLLFD